jgi:hypothetical protein
VGIRKAAGEEKAAISAKIQALAQAKPMLAHEKLAAEAQVAIFDDLMFGTHLCKHFELPSFRRENDLKSHPKTIFPEREFLREKVLEQQHKIRIFRRSQKAHPTRKL